MENEDKNTESSDPDQESTSESDGESKNQAGSCSEEDLSEGEQPVCQGSSIRRTTFEATLLALSKKRNFSKSARTDILKFLGTFIPKPNIPSSNYTFEKMLVKVMNIQYTRYELCVGCSTTINEGKCPNRNCVNFNRQLNDHKIEVCYFIPIKDQLQRILTGMHNE